jgi:hypothetical protein
MAVSVALADGEAAGEMNTLILPPRREGFRVEDTERVGEMAGETERVDVGVRDGSSPYGTSGQVDHGGLPMVNNTDMP